MKILFFLKKNNLTLFFFFFSFFYIRNPIIKISLKKKTQISKEMSIEYSEEKKKSHFSYNFLIANYHKNKNELHKFIKVNIFSSS